MKISLLLTLFLLVGLFSLSKNAHAATKAMHTMQNLSAAIRGEANAANKYMLFAQRADDDGYHQVAKLFRAAAKAESIHRENHQTAVIALGGEHIAVKLDPVTVNSTAENLQVPIKVEEQEQGEMYPNYIAVAKRENAPQAVQTFEYARLTEAEHERLFKKALAELGKNPAEDYYISKISGETVAVPAGQPFAKAETGEYLKAS